MKKSRPNFPYGTDGVVISVDDLKLQEILGVVGKAPRYMAAFKYPAEKATTVVKDIKINVGRTGVLHHLQFLSRHWLQVPMFPKRPCIIWIKLNVWIYE